MICGFAAKDRDTGGGDSKQKWTIEAKIFES